MITVSILINGHPIITRSARNIGLANDLSGAHKYKVDDGRILTHHRGDGAVALAKQLLDGIQEP